MKTWIGLLSKLMALLCITGCGGEEPVSPAPAPAPQPASVAEVLDADMRALLEQRESKLPAAVVYTFQGNGLRVESPLLGTEAVNAALDAVEVLTVLGTSDIYVADSDTYYTFLYADGTEAGTLHLNGSFLAVGKQNYEVESVKALNALDFPAKSSWDTLTLDGPDPELAAFLDRCSSETPARLGVTEGTKAYDITKATAIEDVIDTLYTINFSAAEKGAPANGTPLTLTFQMADGTTYDLRFVDTVYVYTYPAPLGDWSYWTEGTDYLREALEKAKK